MTEAAPYAILAACMTLSTAAGWFLLGWYGRKLTEGEAAE